MSISPLGPAAGRGRGAIFMSGTGVNAEQILRRHAESPRWTPTCLVTDRPATSRAARLAEQFQLPLVAHDIRAFYADHGLKSMSLASNEGRRVRELWTDELRQRLAPYEVNFGILAGFLALCNITADYPCLNVHPGDLTVEVAGRRHLVGHHTIPIERAMLMGLDSLRSSVIVAQPYEAADDMDSGPILGISDPVAIAADGHSAEELAAIAAKRPPRRPPGGYDDVLEALADANLDRLKMGGDLIVFPRVIDAFVAGCYGLDSRQLLHWRSAAGQPWQPVQTVVFGSDHAPVPVPR